MNTRILFYTVSLVFNAFLCSAANPEWIWHDNKGEKIQPGEVRFLRKTFQVDKPVERARLSIAADDDAVVYINGKEVAHSRGHKEPANENVTEHIIEGQNVIAIRAKNGANDIAAVLFMLEVTLPRRQSVFVVSDKTWVSANAERGGWQQTAFDSAAWTRVVSHGKLGDEPWGEVFKVPKATAAESVTALPGFKVELIHSSELGEGSWICMTVDQKGRLIVSPQADTQPLLRFTLDRAGHVAKIEKIPAPVRQAMGLLYAHDSLYVNGHGPNGTGLYRLIDADRDDQFGTNEVHFLKTFGGEGEHGYHAVILGPDKMIYVMNGNHTKVPAGISETSPHKNYQEDFLLERAWDAGGHAVGILAPGGYVVRTDPEGKKWELVLAGFRNAYDFGFNADGELFTFDSDMEWDWGMPWYRPTRINHCTLSSEHGWRSGSADWPEYYADSLPPVVNIGVGSPTGVKFGTDSKYPSRYQKAMYILDWSYGRIIAVHLKPQGASYAGEYETFVKGKPLNVADIEFGKDGAMYFVTGGRGTQSGLYRVSYTGGTRSTASVKSSRTEERAGAQARALRRKLESFHGKKDPNAVDFAWPHLRSDDLYIRYAARIAVEWQDVSQWKDRAVAETNINGGLEALLALARCGGKETQRDLLLALRKFPLDSLSLTQQLAKLRIVQLSFIRQGKPDAEMAKLAMEKLDEHYPANNELLNRELSQLLIYLESPTVVTKTLALLDKAKTQEEQAHYIFYLRNLKKGWTVGQRRHYFEWFRFAQEATKGQVTYPQGSPYFVWANQKKAAARHSPDLLRWFKEAGREYGDGASYPKFLVNFRKDAAASLSETERIALGGLLDDANLIASYKQMKERKFVKEWKLTDLEPALERVGSGRNFQSAKAAFNDSQCILCHRLGNEGGSVGPELTGASSKYSRRDILEAILEPSKVLSDQYQNYIVVKKDGEDVTGKIVNETNDKLGIEPNPLEVKSVEIKKSDIAERRPSKVSPMPEGLVNQLTEAEILDLLAYIESAGKEKAANFTPSRERQANKQ